MSLVKLKNEDCKRIIPIPVYFGFAFRPWIGYIGIWCSVVYFLLYF